MKKQLIRVVYFLLLASIFLYFCECAIAETGDTLVYITRTGSKYHTETCSYLRQSKIEITLKSAVDGGYTACSRCKPPSLDSTISAPSSPAFPSPAASFSPSLNNYTKTYFVPANTPKPTLKPIETPRPTEIPNNNQSLSPLWINVAWITVFVVCSAGVFALYVIIKKYKINDEESNELSEDLNQKEKTEAEMLYKGKDPLFVCGGPTWIKFDRDELPVGPGSRKWGNAYTFYRSSSGSCYHDNFGCSGARIPTHALQVGRLKPCGKCKPVLPNMDWYYEYLRIKRIKEKFNID